MTDETSVDAPAEPATPPLARRPTKGGPRPGRLQRLIAVFGPYAALLVIWGAMSFTKISDQGMAEGHGLLLLFAGLVEPGKRALSQTDEDHPGA